MSRQRPACPLQYHRGDEAAPPSARRELKSAVQPRRRGRDEWRRLVQEWERSGRSAADFAARRGVRPHSLWWWRWFLRREDEQRSGAPKLGQLALIPVEVEADGDEVDEREAVMPAWELLAPSRHVLRVHDRATVALLREVLAAMTPSGRLK